MTHNGRVACDLRQLPMTPVKSAIPLSASLDALFTLVTKLFEKGKLRGCPETDCVITRPGGMEGGIFPNPETLRGLGVSEGWGLVCWWLEFVPGKGTWSHFKCLVSVEGRVRFTNPEGSAVLEFRSSGCFAKKGLKVATRHLWRSLDTRFCSCEGSLSKVIFQNKAVLVVPKQASKQAS